MVKTLRKLIGMASLVGMLAFVPAYAKGPGMGPGMGPMGPGAALPPGVDQAKVQKFCTEVKPLFQKDLELRGELMKLWAQGTPDWTAIESKEIERAKLRVEMHKKAYEAGLKMGPGQRGFNLRRICGW